MCQCGHSVAVRNTHILSFLDSTPTFMVVRELCWLAFRQNSVYRISAVWVTLWMVLLYALHRKENNGEAEQHSDDKFHIDEGSNGVFLYKFLFRIRTIFYFLRWKYLKNFNGLSRICLFLQLHSNSKSNRILRKCSFQNIRLWT